MPARYTRRVRRAPPTFYSKPWKPAEGCLYIIQANLKLRILLPQFPTRNRRYAQPSLASSVVLEHSCPPSVLSQSPIRLVATGPHCLSLLSPPPFTGTRSAPEALVHDVEAAAGRRVRSHYPSHTMIPTRGLCQGLLTHTHVNTASLHPRH